jgi:hypothetical protein
MSRLPTMAAAEPFDARWCAVRYVGAVPVYENQPNAASAAKITTAYRQRAREVLVNAGLIKPTATDIPKDIRDEGKAYGMSLLNNAVDYDTFFRQVTGCDRENGWVPRLL